MAWEESTDQSQAAWTRLQLLLLGRTLGKFHFTALGLSFYIGEMETIPATLQDNGKDEE